ncbi:MAG: hypothetical protein ABR577_08055 [Pyrinomonadaceae bacterium]
MATKKAAKKATKTTKKAAKTAAKKTAPGKGAKKAAAKKQPAAKKSAARKRELIDTGTDKRYVRRDVKGQFKDVVDVGRSLSQDRKRTSKNVVSSGQGDRGDQKKR